MDKNPHQSHSSLFLVSPQRQFMKKHNFYSRMLNSRRTLSALLYMHCSLPVPSTGFSVSNYINHGCPDTIPLHRLVGMSGLASTALKGKANTPKYIPKERFLCTSVIRELYFWVQDVLCTPLIPTLRAVTRTVEY